MIDTPHITETQPQPSATIHLAVPRAQLRTVMGPAMREVMQAVAAQGVPPAGPMFSYHLQRPADNVDFEVGIAVTVPVSASGRVKASQLPAVRVARTIYRGPYEGLGEAWGKFGQWIAAQGLQAGPTLWECYAVGPESGRSPEQWQTELNQPLIG